MLSIILPTLNEKDTILNTIKEIKNYVKTIKHEILVVDDDSPDKTWEVVQNSKINDVKCIRRKKRGTLSSAIILGFSKAQYQNMLVMDADGQHDPSIIKEMLKHNKENNFVTGSRFINGGSVEGWSKKRIMMSKVAALAAKPILTTKIKDPMSGFFMTNKKTYLEIAPHLNPKGYKIFLEMILAHERTKGKTKIKEIPYKFRTRKQGESKLGTKVIKDYGYMLIEQFIKKYATLIKFLITGTTGFIINTTLLWALTEFAGIYYVISGAIATQTAIITNFLMNNFWTWKKRNKKINFINRFLIFNAVSLIGLIITITTLWALTEIGLYYLISNAIGIIIATAWNFLINDKITFKQK